MEFGDPAGDPDRSRDDDGYDIDGGVRLSTINDVIYGNFTGDGVETIGGLLLEQLNRAPERGDRVEVDGYVVDVTSVEGTRISTVRVSEVEGDESAPE